MGERHIEDRMRQKGRGIKRQRERDTERKRKLYLPSDAPRLPGPGTHSLHPMH